MPSRVGQVGDMSVQNWDVSAALDRPAPPDRDAATNYPALFAAALAILAVFRLAALTLNSTDLYMDEAQYWAWSQDLALGYFSKPPLIAWIISATTHLCGDGEACIRLPAVALHLVTAALVYGIGARLYSAQIGFWAGLSYTLLPAVSLSSGIISTDVPLLTAWALALFAFAGLLQRPSLIDTGLLALALGLGLNAKYAMAYFVVCGALYFVSAPASRKALMGPHMWLALAGGASMIAPNLLWNAANGFVTFSHTAENANWKGTPFHPDKAAEFFFAQFGVMGPILFAALLVIAWRAATSKNKLAESDKLLLCFSLPVILLVTTQGLISRAHANWAAPAYVAAIVLVTAVMIRDRAWGWLRTSLALHALVAFAIAGATWQAGRLEIPGIGDPWARTLGNRALAAMVKTEIHSAAQRGVPIKSVVTDDREIAAALAYYARNAAVPTLSWVKGGQPDNYFEMKHPFAAGSPTPALFISSRSPPATSLASSFASVVVLGPRSVPAGQHATRTFHLSVLDTYQEK